MSNDAIVRLLDKIETLEKELKEEKKNTTSRFMQSIDMDKLHYKGIKIEFLYDFYIKKTLNSTLS